jgi:hypothetical protein
VGTERQQIALLGTEGVALERGHLGPLRAVTYFADGRLKKALPALQTEPLARAAALLGDAPLRAFAPGPFEGDWAAGMGGLLRATTAMAASAAPAPGPGGVPALRVRTVLTGAWGADGPTAAGRLTSVYDHLAGEALGRLLGVDHPLEEPRVSGDAEALRLDVLLDASGVAKGLRDATSASMREVMGS